MLYCLGAAVGLRGGGIGAWKKPVHRIVSYFIPPKTILARKSKSINWMHQWNERPGTDSLLSKQQKAKQNMATIIFNRPSSFFRDGSSFAFRSAVMVLLGRFYAFKINLDNFKGVFNSAGLIELAGYGAFDFPQQIKRAYRDNEITKREWLITN